MEVDILDNSEKESRPQSCRPSNGYLNLSDFTDQYDTSFDLITYTEDFNIFGRIHDSYFDSFAQFKLWSRYLYSGIFYQFSKGYCILNVLYLMKDDFLGTRGVFLVLEHGI